jgi:hypothetical protein
MLSITKSKKLLLSMVIVILALLIVFVSDTALVLPVRPNREFWGFTWPPFVGGNSVRIPDWVEYGSFIGIMVLGGALIASALWALGNRLKGILVERKAVR